MHAARNLQATAGAAGAVVSLESRKPGHRPGSRARRLRPPQSCGRKTPCGRPPGGFAAAPPPDKQILTGEAIGSASLTGDGSTAAIQPWGGAAGGAAGAGEARRPCPSPAGRSEKVGAVGGHRPGRSVGHRAPHQGRRGQPSDPPSMSRPRPSPTVTPSSTWPRASRSWSPPAPRWTALALTPTANAPSYWCKRRAWYTDRAVELHRRFPARPPARLPGGAEQHPRASAYSSPGAPGGTHQLHQLGDRRGRVGDRFSDYNGRMVR